MDKALDYAKSKNQAYLEQLKDLIRIPSISTDPAYKAQVKQAADWLVADFERIGLTAKLIPTQRHPLVYAEWMGAGESALTVLVYGHYDVQPASLEDGWDTEPFEPIEKDGFLYARGTSDDKGQFFIHVKAVESILSAQGTLPVNIKFIIEGEEESGGESIEAYVNNHADELKADVCIVSDTSMASTETPAIITGLRGIIAMEWIVTGSKSDLHSGAYGGAVHNPAQALAEMISKLHNPDGSVSVPGFYDDVIPLSDEEREKIAAVKFGLDELQAETGVFDSWGEADYTILERIGARPTLEINGISGGYTGDGFKTVIPAKAKAKISCRLVADQDPEDIYAKVEKYIQSITPPTIRSELENHHGGYGLLTDINNPMIHAAERAYQNGWGYAPVYMREGGSIPILAQIQKRLTIPIVLMGFGLNTDNLHAPNEHFSIDHFQRGIQTSIHFLYECAK